jgi:hypothetical protein
MALFAHRRQVATRNRARWDRRTRSRWKSLRRCLLNRHNNQSRHLLPDARWRKVRSFPPPAALIPSRAAYNRHVVLIAAGVLRLREGLHAELGALRISELRQRAVAARARPLRVTYISPW